MNEESPFYQEVSAQRMESKIKNDLVSFLNNELLKFRQQILRDLSNLAGTKKAIETSTTIEKEDKSEEQVETNPYRFNYLIEPPVEDGDPPEKRINELSAFAAEIQFNSPDLHVLGLKNKQLYWIKTEDCE